MILTLKPDVTHHVSFHTPLLAFYWFVGLAHHSELSKKLKLQKDNYLMKEV